MSNIKNNNLEISGYEHPEETNPKNFDNQYSSYDQVYNSNNNLENEEHYFAKNTNNNSYGTYDGIYNTETINNQESKKK
jgi:hypothetical protein